MVVVLGFCVDYSDWFCLLGVSLGCSTWIQLTVWRIHGEDPWGDTLARVWENMQGTD